MPFNNYTTSSVQNQSQYLSKIDAINSELRALQKQISKNHRIIVPLFKVYVNRRRFEQTQGALKGPVSYRSRHQMSSSSSSSDSDKEGKRTGKLSPKKTVVDQIHAPNFIFSAEEINEVDDHIKKTKACFKEQETYVFQLFLPCLKEKITRSLLYPLTKRHYQGHGKFIEIELMSCHQNTVPVKMGESIGVDGEAIGMECDGMNEKVVRQCAEVVLTETVPSPSDNISSLSDVVPPAISLPPVVSVTTSLLSNVTAQSQNLNPNQSSSSSASVVKPKKNITGPVFKQTNMIRLRWEKDKDLMPTRDEIAKQMLLKQSTLTSTDVRAYIKFSHREYDIVFKTPPALEFFWQDYDKFRNTDLWKVFRVIPITKPETKRVTILFNNDRVPPEDILIWLRRQCKVLTPLRMDIDSKGYWSRGL
ncbi:hypothetical protein XELAEV_18030611mg [Xenopus laevis]|uniref:Uncharacterized protein n=1 Tax=Xenopus laevis TaxID=8355 RepID=A0A974CND9_XENLA|nr:hypothetical protein XELAEV_18030611mg [Xenopus laevis]